MDINELIAIAQQARGKSLAVYSNFHVGAALLASSGKIYSGFNIESSSYGLTICAERVALFKALSEGERHFEKLSIVSDSSRLCPPCGACRQVLWDWARPLTIILANNRGEFKEIPLQILLPHAFEENYLKQID